MDTEETIVIPFFCRKCGKCCREVSVSAEYFLVNINRIAKYIREDPDNLRKHIVNLIRKGKTKVIKLCPFLTSDNTRRIYPIRPEPCRAYSLNTDFSYDRSEKKKVTEKIQIVFDRF